MENRVQSKLLLLKKTHNRKRRWTILISVLSLVVVTATVLCLMLPATTMETICGMEAHTHGDECYSIVETPGTRTIVCGTENIGAIVIHSHSEKCYDTNGSLICSLSAKYEHAHSDACYDEHYTLVCEQEETAGHIHEDACYEEQQLICGQQEIVPHAHGESCYQTERVLVCDKEELILHTHTNECADGSCGQKEVIAHRHTDDCIHETEASNEMVLTCSLPEHAHTPECYPDDGTACGVKEHTHIESCFDANGALICEMQEHEHTADCMKSGVLENESGNQESIAAVEYICGLEAHVHSETCFDENDQIICEKQEHEHTDACVETINVADEEEPEPEILPDENENFAHDPYARIESTRFVENALSQVVLTGDWAKDVLAVAKSQLGYQESTTDYIIDEEGRKKGYTYYGNWYGNSYGDWCAMFASFCLDTAGVKDFPLSGGCQNWIKMLSAEDINLWHPAIDSATGECYVPKPGDLIFYDYNCDGRSDHVGIVLQLIAETEQEPALIQSIEGNCTDMVCIVTHAQAYEGIKGYGELPENSEKKETNDTICISAETQSGIEITISGSIDAFPYAPDELTLSVNEIDADEDIISEHSIYNSIYIQLVNELNLSPEKLWSKGIRMFEISLKHDEDEIQLTDSVLVTIKSVENAVPYVYAFSPESQTWSSVDFVSKTNDGDIQFETKELLYFGIETSGRPELRLATVKTSEGNEPDTLTVDKVWSDGNNVHVADQIEVGLLFDDGVNDPMLEDCQILSAANNWTYTFTLQHPMEDNGRLQYSVIENVPGYQTQYSAITKAPEMDDEGWWVPADTLEDGETYVFVSTFNGSTYAPAANHDEDTSSASFMFASSVNVVSGPVTINGTTYAEYLTNVDDAASFTASAQTGGGFILQNQHTQRYMDVRGYCYFTPSTYSLITFVNGRLRHSSGRWLMQYRATGNHYDFTQATTERDASEFRLFKLIPGESVNAYQTTITNKYINPHQGGIPGTDRPEIYKTIDWLGDNGNNTDTTLRGEEFYRLYLDVRALTNNQPVDLLLVLDNSGSMFTPSLSIDGRLRNDILLSILNTLIPEFLAANSNNRISHVYFSGPASFYDYPAQVPTNITEGNVADDAWLTQEWTSNASAAVGSLMNYCMFVNHGSGGGTNYAQGIAAARVQVDKSIAAGRTPYVLFLSDGVPTYYIQSNGQRGGNGYDTAGKSIQSAYYNVSKKNVEACRQPTLNAVAAFRAAYPDITMSAVGFSSLVQEGHTSIMSAMPYNGGFYMHATDTASLTEALTMAFAAASTSNVTVTDELSPYVQIPVATDAQADFRVTMTNVSTGAVTVLYQNGSVTQAGQGIVQSVGYSSGNGTESNGTVQLKFMDDYVLDSDYRYTISFNVQVTQRAYEEFANNGYGGVTGDAESDYPITNNETSAGKPGFHSNSFAYVDYILDGTHHTDYYAYPVVQVMEQQIRTVDFTISKSVINGDLNEEFAFEIVFTDSNGNPFTEIPEGNGYSVDNTAGKITFTLRSGQSVTVPGLPENLTAVLRELNHDGYIVLIKEGNQTLYTADSGSILLTDDREITVVNNAGTVLPETGGNGTLIYKLSGAVILLSALIFGCSRRRRERKSENRIS